MSIKTLSLFLTLLAITTCMVSANDDIILPPPITTAALVPMCMIIIQERSIPATAYVSVSKLLQSSSSSLSDPIPLWVAIPSHAGSIVSDDTLTQSLSRVMTSLHSAGMPSNTTLYIVAHGRSGLIVQSFLPSSLSPISINNFAGLILWGSFLTRANRNPPYAVPILTVGCELDGIIRSTRLVENHLFNSRYLLSSRDPVLMIRGCNHVAFSDDDITFDPSVFNLQDFSAEISASQAHTSIVSNTLNFMIIHTTTSSIYGPSSIYQQAVDAIQQAQDDSLLFMQPLIDAMNLEGSYNIMPPCNDNSVNNCQLGSAWAETAQKALANLTTYDSTWTDDVVTLNVTNLFKITDQVMPYHHPKIDNSCQLNHNSNLKNSKCQLNMVTETENIYEKTNANDDGSTYVSALEQRAKMKSRQAILIALGQDKAGTDQDDQAYACAHLNQMSLQWAFQHADKHVLARYQNQGNPMLMTKDDGPQDGYHWIYNPIVYTVVSSSSSPTMKAMQLAAPCLFTQVFLMPDLLKGFHYCKLLSPARAMEWIYVDSLRSL